MRADATKLESNHRNRFTLLAAASLSSTESLLFHIYHLSLKPVVSDQNKNKREVFITV